MTATTDHSVTLKTQYEPCPGLRAAQLRVVLENPMPAADPTIDLTAAAYGGFSTISAIQYNNTICQYDPAYLTGGSSATSVIGTWTAVNDGEFSITLDGTALEVTALDFSACTDMDGVATVIQTGLNSASGTTETVTWDTDHFIIASSVTTPLSAVSVLADTAAGLGTDISGAGATAFMDSDTGHGVPTGNAGGYVVQVKCPTTTATILLQYCDNNAVADGILISVPAATAYGDGATFDMTVFGN